VTLGLPKSSLLSSQFIQSETAKLRSISYGRLKNLEMTRVDCRIIIPIRFKTLPQVYSKKNREAASISPLTPCKRGYATCMHYICCICFNLRENESQVHCTDQDALNISVRSSRAQLTSRTYCYLSERGASTTIITCPHVEPL
jgi:hypothetical protein